MDYITKARYYASSNMHSIDNSDLLLEFIEDAKTDALKSIAINALFMQAGTLNPFDSISYTKLIEIYEDIKEEYEDGLKS